MHRRLGLAWTALLSLFTVLLVACGTTQLPEAPPTGPLAASNVSVNTTGNGQATVSQSSVTFTVDNSGTLVVHLMLTSTASTAETVAVRGSLFDQNGKTIGDVTGGTINLDPGAGQQTELTGPAPNGTISSVTFEVTTEAAPTPTAATPSGVLGTPAA